MNPFWIFMLTMLCAASPGALAKEEGESSEASTSVNLSAQVINPTTLLW
jgi:hypothetical protein